MIPLQAQGQLLLSRLPVPVFEPDFADAVNIDLLRADASYKVSVAYRAALAGPVIRVSGNVALEDFKANTVAASEELLAWKGFELRGLTLALDRPGHGHTAGREKNRDYRLFCASHRHAGRAHQFAGLAKK